MVAIHIRDVPESVASALRERAARHQQSMQQELLEILREAAAERVAGDTPPPIRLATVRTSGESTWRREELYDDQGR
jgi:plasmid stability protein